MRISDWSSDVCSSDLIPAELEPGVPGPDDHQAEPEIDMRRSPRLQRPIIIRHLALAITERGEPQDQPRADGAERITVPAAAIVARRDVDQRVRRSEEHTSELQSLMRSSYAVFCLKKKTK